MDHNSDSWSLGGTTIRKAKKQLLSIGSLASDE